MSDRERGHGSLPGDRGHSSLSRERGHGSLPGEHGQGSLPGERGQSLVEMALLLPVLLLVMHGAIDFGRVFYAKITVANAARVAARYGSWTPQYESAIVDRALDEASRTLTLQPDDVTVTCDNGACSLTSDWIEVT
ncbi:MAG: TadE/TadG family type IV pilus assembly protein, partial [Anaerolineae bacterium]